MQRTRLRVKEVIDAKGTDMAKVSRRADIAYNTVRNICTNPDSDVNLYTLDKIAAVLDVPVSELIEDVPVH